MSFSKNSLRVLIKLLSEVYIYIWHMYSLVANECDKSVARVSSENSVKEEIQAVSKTSQILDNVKSDPGGNDEKNADTKSQDKDGTSKINSESRMCFISENIITL